MNRIQELIKELCPNGVEWKKLGEICSVYDGTHQTPKYVEDGIPFISVENIKDIYNSKKYISKEAFDAYKIKPQIGDVFLTRIGTIGACAVFNKQEDIAYYVSLALLRPSNTLNSYYLKYILESSIGVAELRKRTLINAVPIKVNKEEIGKIEIPLPPLSVQTEIVRILDKFVEQQEQLEKLIELRTKQYEYYREEMLTAKEGWETKTLGEICDIKGRIGFRGYTREDQVKKGEGAISLSPGNIENSKLFFDDCAYISWDKYEESPEIMVNLNDVIFCKTGSTVGKVAIVTELVEKTTINPQLVVLKNVQCSNKNLYYYLTRGEIQYDVKKFAGIGSVPNISQEKLSGLTIKLPNEDIQNEIVKTLDSFESSISALTSALELSKKRYEHYRDEMLRF